MALFDGSMYLSNGFMLKKNNVAEQCRFCSDGHKYLNCLSDSFYRNNKFLVQNITYLYKLFNIIRLKSDQMKNFIITFYI